MSKKYEKVLVHTITTSGYNYRWMVYRELGEWFGFSGAMQAKAKTLKALEIAMSAATEHDAKRLTTIENADEFLFRVKGLSELFERSESLRTVVGAVYEDDALAAITRYFENLDKFYRNPTGKKDPEPEMHWCEDCMGWHESYKEDE